MLDHVNREESQVTRALWPRKLEEPGDRGLWGAATADAVGGRERLRMIEQFIIYDCYD